MANEDLDKLFDEAVDLDQEFENAEDVSQMYAGSTYGNQQPLYQPEELAPGQMTKSEAAARQATSIYSLGLIDPLVGAGAAGVTALEPGISEAELNEMYPPKEGEPPFKIQDETPGEAYEAAKVQQKAMREKAWKDQMGASALGTVIGSFMTPIPGGVVGKMGKIGQAAEKILPSLKGYEKIKKARDLAKIAKDLKQYKRAAKLTGMARQAAAYKGGIEGAKAGVAFGLTQGDSKLLDGDISGALEDAINEGFAGAVTGTVFTGVTDEIVDQIKNSPFIQRVWKSFTEGVKGKVRNPDVAAEIIRKEGEKVFNNFRKLRQNLGKDYDLVDEIAAKNNIAIDTSDDLNKIWDIASNIEDPTAKKKVKSVLDALRPYVKENPAESKAVKQVQKQILKKKLTTSEQIDEAAIKAEQKALKKALMSSDEYLGTNENLVDADEIIPGSRPSTMAVVREDTKQVINPKTGEIQERVITTPETFTEFKPGEIRKGIDPETGLEFAASKDYGSGKVMAAISEAPGAEKFDATSLKLKQAKELEDTLKGFTALEGENKLPGSVQSEIQSSLSSMKDKRIAATEGIEGLDVASLNKKYKALKGALGVLGEEGANTKQVQNKIKDKIFNNLAQSNDTKANDYIRELTEYVSEYDKDLAKEVAQKFTELRNLYLTNKGAGYTPAGAGWQMNLLGGVRELSQKLANLAGRAGGLPYRAIKGVATSAASKGASLANKSISIITSDKAQIQKLIDKLNQAGAGAQQFIAPLQKALSSSDRVKTSIMYGLYQQPAFRDTVNWVLSEENKKKQE